VSLAESERAFRPNRYGIYHASGNAAEWTQSVYRHYNAANPYRDDDRNLDEAPGMRVTRGGSWYSANTVRLSLGYREEFQPEMSSDDLGFRLACVITPGPVALR
jgi:formylglycine-generating enzyme required for sulfatase activity